MSSTICRGDVVRVITASEAAPIQFAAQEMKRILKQSVGVRFEMADSYALSVQLVETSGDDYCAISIDADKRQIIVRGQSSNAVRDGVFDFLEKVVGVRWLYPGSDGECVPVRKELRLKTSAWVLPEPMPYRGLHICGGVKHYDQDIVEWMSHCRCNRKMTHHCEVSVFDADLKLLGLAPDTTTHSFACMIPDAEFYDTHPEYFAVVGGKRIRHADGGQLCLSNAGLRRTYIERLAAYAEKYPGVSIVGIPSNDGFGWCECEDCLRMDGELGCQPGDVSGRVWAFSIEVANALKERLPGRLIGQYVYSNFRRCPVETLPENMAIVYTVGKRCFKHMLGDLTCEVNAPHREQLMAWAARCEHVYLYEYYAHSGWNDLPFPVWRVTAKDMKWCRENNIDGFLTEVLGPEHGWWRSGHLGLSSTLASLANPEMNVDEFLDDYCTARFGAAAKPLRQYLDLFENGLKGLPCGFRDNVDVLPHLLTEDMRRQCGALIAQGAACLGDAPVFYKKQFERERELFEKWCRIVHLQTEYEEPGHLVAKAFPGWEDALESGDSEGMGVLTNYSYHIPLEGGETRFRVYADAQSIYFAFDCMEPDMAKLKTNVSENCFQVYEDDSVEIFTAISLDASECAHFLVNASGFKAASWCDIPGMRWNWSWPVEWETRVKHYPDRWTLVARIPLDAIGAAGNFYTSVIRNRKAGGRNELSGFPKGGAFFRPEAYCQLQVTDISDES